MIWHFNERQTKLHPHAALDNPESIGRTSPPNPEISCTSCLKTLLKEDVCLTKKRAIGLSITAAFIISILGLPVAHMNSQENIPDYKNPRLPIERRVADLLSRMTLEEKVAQLTC